MTDKQSDPPLTLEEIDEFERLYAFGIAKPKIAALCAAARAWVGQDGIDIGAADRVAEDICNEFDFGQEYVPLVAQHIYCLKPSHQPEPHKPERESITCINCGQSFDYFVTAPSPSVSPAGQLHNITKGMWEHAEQEVDELREALRLANKDKESILRRIERDIRYQESCKGPGEINRTLQDGAIGALKSLKDAIAEWFEPREPSTPAFRVSPTGETTGITPDRGFAGLPSHLHPTIAPVSPAGFDFEKHLARQRAFSEKTFGPGTRTQGIIDHIRKELAEIEAEPSDISEWIDVVILALDGAWRAGFSPTKIIASLVAKQDKNEAREWPDWRTMSPDKAIEHHRVSPTGEQCPDCRMPHPQHDWECLRGREAAGEAEREEEYRRKFPGVDDEVVAEAVRYPNAPDGPSQNGLEHAQDGLAPASPARTEGDLVRRLRDYEGFECQPLYPMLNEAADALAASQAEIERLRKDDAFTLCHLRVEQLTQELENLKPDNRLMTSLMKENAALRAEVERLTAFHLSSNHGQDRLRAALTEILSYPDGYVSDHIQCHSCVDVHEIANAALRADNDRLKARLKELEVAAKLLRSCQRAYMANRGNDELGMAVGAAALALDAVLKPQDTPCAPYVAGYSRNLAPLGGGFVPSRTEVTCTKSLT